MARCKEVAHGECSQFGSPADSIDLTRKESNLVAHSQDQTTPLLPLHTGIHLKKHFPHPTFNKSDADDNQSADHALLPIPSNGSYEFAIRFPKPNHGQRLPQRRSLQGKQQNSLTFAFTSPTIPPYSRSAP